MSEKEDKAKEKPEACRTTFPYAAVPCASCFGADIVRVIWRVRNWLRDDSLGQKISRLLHLRFKRPE